MSSNSLMATIRRQIILTHIIHTDWNFIHAYVQNSLLTNMHAHNNMTTHKGIKARKEKD